ncbi:hypothetical protein [Mangrovimonas sp. YM274]|uniref:hypothetical protein n=1 Tax=Mangrovimonas sp. YM274 TaxID=3070660 RepID=UPI0027DBC057|nr:hypothetical protein [Mangrovimonas sp. YM274]WMI68880.1 hypothetical protein RBH95_00590 [Mangrovimonas sp. YM274]
MSDKKHIDRLFQEQFKDFEATPKEDVWNNIEQRLHGNKRKRKVVGIWWQLAGVAALLALLLTAGKFIFSPPNSIQENTIPLVEEQTNSETNDSALQQTTTDSTINSNNSINHTVTENNRKKDAMTPSENGPLQQGKTSISVNQATTVAISSEKNSSQTKNNSLRKAPQQQKNALYINSNEGLTNNSPNLPEPSPYTTTPSEKNTKTIDTLKDEKTRVAGITPSESSDILDKNQGDLNKTLDTPEEIAQVNEKEENTIEEAIAEANEQTNEKEKEEKLNRWNISPNVAPVYFNTLGKGSPIDEQFVNNSKSGEINTSYGVSGSYAFNDKIKVRVGVNKVDLGYSTKNVIAYNSTNNNNAQLQNLRMSNSASNNAVMSTQNLNSSSPEVMNVKTFGALEQQFGFIEVPVELEYALVNKKLGLNLIGGFSTLFTNHNDVYATGDGYRIHIGEATNINDMSYSANLGLGMNYNVSRKIKVNLEPMFKYQLNTFNNTSGDFQPYFIGVYTGLSYKF